MREGRVPLSSLIWHDSCNTFCHDMKTLEEFRRFFAEELSQELAAAESARKKTIFKGFLVWVAAVPLTALATWASISFMGKEYWFPLIILNGLVFFFLAYMLWREVLSSRRFYNLFKGRVIEGIIRYVDDRLHYIPHRAIPVSTFVKSRLFGKPVHKYEGDDYCFMQLENGTVAEFSEAHAFSLIKENNQRRQEPIFEGLFGHIKTAEGRIGDLYILPKGLSDADLHQPGRVQAFTPDHSEFAEHFVVYANSGAAVRRCLTPSLVQAFLDFRAQHPDCLLYYASHGSDIYVGMTASKPLFEPHVWQSLTDVQSLESFFVDLSAFMRVLGSVADLSGQPQTSEPQPAT